MGRKALFCCLFKKGSDPVAFNTSVLSGYAKTYAQARNAGASDAAAHAAATQAYGTGGSGSGNTFSAFDPGGSGKVLTYEIKDPEWDPLRQQQQIQQYDPTAYINQLKEAQRQNRIAALEKARESALSNLESYKTNTLASLDTQRNKGLTQLEAEQSAIAPVYYDKRNQAAAASDVSALNFAQYAAARGIKGPAGAMPEIYRRAGLQGQIGALDRAEASDIADIERRRSQLGTDYDTLVNALNQDYNQKVLGVNTNYDTDLVQAQADVEAQALQNYINQMNLNRQYELQVGQATGSIGGTPTLEARRFDWSRSSSNPEVQYRILANKRLELENAAQEIQNSYLPETLKMQAKLLEEKVRAGSLDYDTALAQLNQIKAQTAKYLSDANSGGSSGMTAYQQAQLDSREDQELWNRAIELAKNDKRLNNPSDTAANTFDQLVDAYYKQLVAQKYGGVSFY